MKALAGMRASMPKKRNKAAIRQAALQAKAIQDALAASFAADQVANAWVDANHHPDTTAQQARDWARTNVLLSSGAIYTALSNTYATAWVFGKDAGREAYAQAALAGGADMTPEFRAALSVGWDNWTPGNRAAAALANPPEGFSKVLARRDIVLRGIDQTTTDRIGTLLADGLSRGLPADAIAANLTELGLSNSRALTIANTEMNNTLQDAQVQSYKDSGVEQMLWTVVVPCDICAENDGEIRNIGEEFPSGDTQPTVHPGCYCDLAPVVDLLLDDSEKAALPERPTTQGVPGSKDIDRALNRLSILPNPPEANMEDIEKYVESPWAVVPIPTVDPLAWDDAKVTVVNIADLKATDEVLSRKKIKHHIKAMGQALTPNRSYPLVAVVDGVATIIDGHHRLMSLWLLGLDQAPVWLIKE
jgi:SPP1 gp7 family putative phage head morphogenesis protein